MINSLNISLNFELWDYEKLKTLRITNFDFILTWQGTQQQQTGTKHNYLANRISVHMSMDSTHDREATVLDRLYEVVVARRDERPAGSYVVQLLDGGWPAISAKVSEEAQEVIEAARSEGDEALAHEVADLLFHVFVLMASRDVEPGAVYAELAQRFGIGGLVEKAARDKTGKPTTGAEHGTRAGATKGHRGDAEEDRANEDGDRGRLADPE